MIRLAIRCRPEQAEFVLADLAALAPNGVEERAIEAPADGSRGPLVEFAIYGGPGEMPDVGELDAAIGDGLVEVEATEVEDGWSERWREFHRPVLVGGRIWVRPPWIDADASGPIDLVVDPGRAFGTGAHITTRLCLEKMLEFTPSGPFSDLGTGSGVLAIAAAKLGWGPVYAYDHEPESVEATGENAARNGVEVEVAPFDLRVEAPPVAPMTVANLTAPLLTEVAGRMDRDHRPESLICSGILPDQIESVAAAFGRSGMDEVSRRESDGWAVLVLRAR